MKRRPRPLTNKAGDVRPLAAADFKRMRPAREVDPELVAAYERGDLKLPARYRKASKPQNKIHVVLDLPKEVVTFFKSGGPGWQTRISRALVALVEAVGHSSP